MDIKDSYLHGTVGVVKSISVSADKLKYKLADIAGTVKEVTLPVATQTANGLLSKEDKKKLDNMIATKVANDLILKIDSGTTEGTSLYTYNGSAAKTLDIKSGTGIAFSKTAGALQIFNSGVRSIATGTTNGTISVNTNGTSANVAVKGLGSAAYTSSGGYIRQINIGTITDPSNLHTKVIDYFGDHRTVMAQLKSEDGLWGHLLLKFQNPTQSTYGVDGSGLFMTGSTFYRWSFTGKDTTEEPLVVNKYKIYDEGNLGVVSSSVNGLAPKVINTNTATVGSAYYVLASTNGSATPSWYKLPSNAFANDDTKVTQTNTTTNASYRVLFSGNNNDTTETTTARKSGKLLFNPNTGDLTAERFVGGFITTKSPNIANTWKPQTVMAWFPHISKNSNNYAGDDTGFPVASNANGILWLGLHDASSNPSTSLGHGYQLGFSSNGNIYTRYFYTNVPTTANGGSWKQIAYTTSNITGNAATATHASTADKLKTKRKIWGQNFDGTADVSGDMTGVGTINNYFNFQKGTSSNAALHAENIFSTVDYVHLYVSNLDKSRTDRPLVLQHGYGNVGIGASQPTHKLTVNGDVKATSFIGNLDGTYVNKLTNYNKATAIAALAATDTLNTALGKLEYKADVAYDLVKGAYDGDGTIENLAEILKVLEGIKDTETIQAIIGKYLPLAGGTMEGTIHMNNNVLTWSGNTYTWDNTPNGLLGINTSSTDKGGYYGGIQYKQYYGLQLRVAGGDLTKFEIRGHNGDYWGDWGKLWHSKNMGENSGLNADMLDGYHANSTNTPWNSIPVIRDDGVMEVGGFIDFHYDNTTNSSHSTTLVCTGNHSNTVNLPSTSGTLALTSGTIDYAKKLKYSTQIKTQEDLDGFLEANTFKVAPFSSITGPGFAGNDGMVLSIPWTSTSYGAQIIIDDNHGGVVKIRQKENTTWSNWYTFLTSKNYTSYLPLLNSSDTHATNTSVIYSPTTAGTSGQVLTSNGSGAPSWSDVSNLNVNSAKVLKPYAARPTSLNINFSDGGIRNYKATASTTEGKCSEDAHIIHCAWDAENGHNYQLALINANKNTFGLEFRGQSGYTWSDWHTVLTDLNYTTYINSTNFPGLAGVRSVTINNDYLKVNTNGTITNLTIPYATKATSLKHTSLTTGQDLNTLTTEGVYSHTQTSVCNSLVNGPTGRSNGECRLEVINCGHSQHTLQLLYTKAGKSGEIWYRMGTSDATWSTWKKIAFASDYLPLSGGTMTGNILLGGGNAILGSGNSIPAKFKDYAAINPEVHSVWLAATGTGSNNVAGSEASGILFDGNTIKMWTPMDNAPQIIDSDDGTAYTLLHSGNITKSHVGLGNVDNTADANKSVKYATSAGSASKLGSTTIVSSKAFSLVNTQWIDVKDASDNVYTFTNLASGTYAVQITCGNLVASGIMSVYKNIDDTAGDEIPLHVYHDSSQPWRPYLRTSGKKLQISSNDAAATSRTVTIKIAQIL